LETTDVDKLSTFRQGIVDKLTNVCARVSRETLDFQKIFVRVSRETFFVAIFDGRCSVLTPFQPVTSQCSVTKIQQNITERPHKKQT